MSKFLVSFPVAMTCYIHIEAENEEEAQKAINNFKIDIFEASVGSDKVSIYSLETPKKLIGKDHLHTTSVRTVRVEEIKSQ